jgi:GMP synthase (glutamine-hydrolysing) A subunit
MRILLVDNARDLKSWGCGEFRRLAHLVPGATFYVRRAPLGDLPKTPVGYDRVILSGSGTSAMEDAPWIERLHEFVAQTLDSGLPLLGVCYGHQTMARVVAGRQVCRKAATHEIGWTEIELDQKAKLFEGLSRKFYTFSSHYDEVATLPSGFKSLAHSQACQVQAMQLDEKPIYGVQFHPERDGIGGERTFEETRVDPKTKDDFLLNANRTKELFDQKVTDTIFKNFFTM